MPTHDEYVFGRVLVPTLSGLCPYEVRLVTGENTGSPWPGPFLPVGAARPE